VTTRFEVIRATAPVITAALALAVDERQNPGGVDVRRLDDTTAVLIRAARRLTALVDDLEAGDIPKAWRREPERKAS
jgi:hypothetical protein